MSVPLPAFRRVRLTQQCVIHPQDKGGNYLPCASEDWVLFVSLAADEEKIILRTEHRCLPIEPGGALLLPPNVCHELPFVQAPCLMLGFSAADDGQAVFEFPQLQGTPAWMFLLLCPAGTQRQADGGYRNRPRLPPGHRFWRRC